MCQGEYRWLIRDGNWKWRSRENCIFCPKIDWSNLWIITVSGCHNILFTKRLTDRIPTENIPGLKIPTEKSLLKNPCLKVNTYGRTCSQSFSLQGIFFLDFGPQVLIFCRDFLQKLFRRDFLWLGLLKAGTYSCSMDSVWQSTTFTHFSALLFFTNWVIY